MNRMLKTHRNTIVNTMIALLFVGGCVFLMAVSWDAGEAEDVCDYCGADVTTTSTCDCCDGQNRLADSDKNGASNISQNHSEVSIY